jgi:hypothetical protein
MGDVVTLVEKAQESMNNDDAMAAFKKMMTGASWGLDTTAYTQCTTRPVDVKSWTRGWVEDARRWLTHA